MALPENGAAWPPPEWADYYARIAVDDAWYSGDRDRLARIYGREQKTPRRRLWARRSSAHRPGRDTRLHVPFAGDIAQTSADMLFANMPRVVVEDARTQTRLDTLIADGHVQQALLSAAEQAAALSGVYLRATWDRELVDRPLLTAVQPDNAVPEWRWGMLAAVSFWRELSGSTTRVVWRHIERHEPGRILHALYQGSGDNVGRRVPLAEHPDTAALVGGLEPDGESTLTGIRQLTATYVPNMTPNRLHRSSPMGRSDYAAPIYDQLDSLDEVWTSWMRDIRLARARLLVPDGYLRSNGPGRGATFDEDAEVYAQLNMPPTENGGITLSQFDIRVDEHQRTAEALMRQAAQSAGYAARAFGLDQGGGAARTATEVDSDDDKSEVTRRKKAGHWKQGLADILGALLELDVAHFGSQAPAERPRVEFSDGVAESPMDVATTLDLLNRAQAVSTATRVQILHPDWDDQAVAAEAAAILRETGMGTVPDPGGTYPLAA
ncbi:phage portal protein [Streptomyces sp. OfavH-34-F]|uniref:phage portal protein n=1 Tax=Streptomyces sp. OfavH-34-F TaxID=2917760 RepID=UPI001EF1C620|nr:phage portal protein [Streptomyces sp. OfavH-34-F]MCG7524932.1 phage portal protein [Streptomyces sp. OfavH-34-F]